MNKNKKIIIVIVNILIILILFLGLNTYLEKNYRNFIGLINLPFKENPNIDMSSYEFEEPPKDMEIPFTDEKFKEWCGEKRQVFGEQYNKKPIIVFGCSYAYGHGLTKEESFPNILSSITQRPVISFAGCASNIFSNLVDLQNILDTDENLSEKIRDAEYIIYLYMNHHITRYLDVSQYDFNLVYEDLFELNQVEKFLSKVFLFRYLIVKTKINKLIKEFPDSHNCSLFVNKAVKISAEKMQKISPDAKFIVVIYDEKISKMYCNNEYIKFHADVSDSPSWKDLEKNGITVIHTRDLMGFNFDKKYKLEHDIAGWHPNAKVWKDFTPVFAKKYIKQ